MRNTKINELAGLLSRLPGNVVAVTVSISEDVVFEDARCV